jgi:hypothetical protein
LRDQDRARFESLSLFVRLALPGEQGRDARAADPVIGVRALEEL